MSKQSNRHAVSRENPVNKNNDPYGIFKQEMEVDSDLNEDPNRERLLDESMDHFLNIKNRNRLE